ncbi:MAG: ribosomal-protein-alanine N-acetyltransferase [Ruminococcaceae bacterium]|nr:ribosomal-protein-alanine N-acetyltransferase [Oscillospiraceae bacterium]
MRTVRRALPSDLPALEALEKVCFSMPWSKDELSAELALPYKRVLVGEEEGNVVGYGIFSCLFDQWEVERVGVSPDCRRSGWGRMLMEPICAELKAQEGGGTLFLEVRASNTGALALYRSLGFEQYGRRVRYYERPKEDAILMRLDGTGRNEDNKG